MTAPAANSVNDTSLTIELPDRDLGCETPGMHLWNTHACARPFAECYLELPRKCQIRLQQGHKDRIPRCRSKACPHSRQKNYRDWQAASDETGMWLFSRLRQSARS